MIGIGIPMAQSSTERMCRLSDYPPLHNGEGDAVFPVVFTLRIMARGAIRKRRWPPRWKHSGSPWRRPAV